MRKKLLLPPPPASKGHFVENRSTSGRRCDFGGRSRLLPRSLWPLHGLELVRQQLRPAALVGPQGRIPLLGKGRDLPPLVTTSDTPVPPPGTTVLYGGRHRNQQCPHRRPHRLRHLAADAMRFVGVGGRFWGLANDDSAFALNSDGLPTKPSSVRSSSHRAHRTRSSSPTPSRGSTATSASTAQSEVFGVDATPASAAAKAACSRTDFVTGYQFARINESLRIHSGTQNTLSRQRQYSTYNEFHGGVIGVLHDLQLRLRQSGAAGPRRPGKHAPDRHRPRRHQRRRRRHSTWKQHERRPRQILRRPGTGGHHWLPVLPCMQVHAGYTFLYWSHVARPESRSTASAATTPPSTSATPASGCRE